MVKLAYAVPSFISQLRGAPSREDASSQDRCSPQDIRRPNAAHCTSLLNPAVQVQDYKTNNSPSTNKQIVEPNCLLFSAFLSSSSS